MKAIWVLASFAIICLPFRAAEKAVAQASDFKGVEFGSLFRDFWKSKVAPDGRTAQTEFDVSTSVMRVTARGTIAHARANMSWIFVVSGEGVAIATKHQRSGRQFWNWPKSAKDAVAEAKFAGVSGTFPTGEFSSIKTALTEKYGPPSTTKIATYTNGFGAKFDGRKLTWSNDDIYISLDELSETRDRGFLYLVARKFSSQMRDTRPPDL